MRTEQLGNVDDLKQRAFSKADLIFSENTFLME